MPLSAERYTTKRENKHYSDPVVAAALIYAGAIVVLGATGFAAPGSTATGLIARGVAKDTVDNSAGADGDLNVETETGVFLLKNSAAADQITRADIGGSAYIVDDETVAKTDGGATRSIAGVIKDVNADGVFVHIS